MAILLVDAVIKPHLWPYSSTPVKDGGGGGAEYI